METLLDPEVLNSTYETGLLWLLDNVLVWSTGVQAAIVLTCPQPAQITVSIAKPECGGRSGSAGIPADQKQ